MSLIKESPDLCDSDPLLYDSSPLRRRGGSLAGGGGTRGGVCRLAEQRHDDLVGDGVELSDGGPDGRRHVVLLVPLRPDAAQTLVRHHPDKQSLKPSGTSNPFSIDIWRWVACSIDYFDLLSRTESVRVSCSAMAAGEKSMKSP